jgi:hypothetical protein
MNAIQKRWGKCEKLASITKVPKSVIFKYLKQADQELVQRLLSDNPSASDAKEFHLFMTEKLVHDDIKIHEPKATSASDEMKIGFWFIKKIGSPERAIKVINACATGLKKLEGD